MIVTYKTGVVITYVNAVEKWENALGVTVLGDKDNEIIAELETEAILSIVSVAEPIIP